MPADHAPFWHSRGDPEVLTAARVLEESLSLTIGENIRVRRTILRLSQEELGSRIGWSGTSVGYVERGKRSLSTKNLAAFAAALRCSPIDLLSTARSV
ncbi:MAG: helix-turn-helix domain-containing protein [Methanothrix harundinacea]|nr:helix-turn-helix domain-containing protein [Methanothrix harundinacea]